MMDIEFEDEYNERVYADWMRVLIDQIFGHRMDLHHDLYEATHRHRIEHNKGFGDGPCTAWPSPPARAPMWHLLADMLNARRFLEVGCGLGYTAALMADAGGTDARVDTIENDPLHADMAEKELSHKGLVSRVRILRGEARDVLPTLADHYDVVFSDATGQNWLPHLTRLTRRGGVLIDGRVKGLLFDEVEGVLARLNQRLEQGAGEPQRAYAEAEERYRKAVENIVKLAAIAR